jgi:hypothetical protein
VRRLRAHPCTRTSRAAISRNLANWSVGEMFRGEGWTGGYQRIPYDWAALDRGVRTALERQTSWEVKEEEEEEEEGISLMRELSENAGPTMPATSGARYMPEDSAKTRDFRRAVIRSRSERKRGALFGRWASNETALRDSVWSPCLETRRTTREPLASFIGYFRCARNSLSPFFSSLFYSPLRLPLILHPMRLLSRKLFGSWWI